MKLTVEQYLAIAVPVFKICKDLSDSPRVDIPELAGIHNIIEIISSFKPDELPERMAATATDVPKPN